MAEHARPIFGSLELKGLSLIVTFRQCTVKCS